MDEQPEPTTSNHFDGEATNVVQAGTTGHVQIVHEGLAVIGDVHGGLHYGGTTQKPTDEEQQ